MTNQDDELEALRELLAAVNNTFVDYEIQQTGVMPARDRCNALGRGDGSTTQSGEARTSPSPTCPECGEPTRLECASCSWRSKEIEVGRSAVREALELLPCPWCGLTEHLDYGGTTHGDTIYCEKCQANGPSEHDTNQECATEAWNERHAALSSLDEPAPPAYDAEAEAAGIRNFEALEAALAEKDEKLDAQGELFWAQEKDHADAILERDARIEELEAEAKSNLDEALEWRERAAVTPRSPEVAALIEGCVGMYPTLRNDRHTYLCKLIEPFLPSKKTETLFEGVTRIADSMTLDCGIATPGLRELRELLTAHRAVEAGEGEPDG